MAEGNEKACHSELEYIYLELSLASLGVVSNEGSLCLFFEARATTFLKLTIHIKSLLRPILL